METVRATEVALLPVAVLGVASPQAQPALGVDGRDAPDSMQKSTVQLPPLAVTEPFSCAEEEERLETAAVSTDARLPPDELVVNDPGPPEATTVPPLEILTQYL